jgi:hypothetical protein
MSSPLDSRRERLRKLQNRDGGWPYVAGKSSWLEPSVWVLLALHGDGEAEAETRRGWEFVRSLATDGGGWRPTPAVQDTHWTTALAVTLHCVRGVFDERFERGIDWLVARKGAEGKPWSRIQHWLAPEVVAHDHSLQGWPWYPETSSWIEPTAHTLVALKKASPHVRCAGLAERVGMGQKMMLDRRCRDAGWNYGNRRVLGEDLTAYPETTAVALLAFQGQETAEIKAARALAGRFLAESHSELASAWLTLALRTHGVAYLGSDDVPESAAEKSDCMLTALRVLGAPPDHWALLATVTRGPDARPAAAAESARIAPVTPAASGEGAWR